MDEILTALKLRVGLPLCRGSRAQMVKNLPAVWETWVPSQGWEDPLEKGKATHSNILIAQLGKNLSAMQETWVPSQGWEDPLERE